MNKKKFNTECILVAESLEVKAETFSLLYTICILIGIILGIFTLGEWGLSKHFLFIVGAIGLLSTLLPLVFKNTIEKIQGYRELASEFKNLAQDFSNKGNSKNNLKKIKALRKKLTNYPIGSFCEFLARRRVKDENKTKIQTN